MYIFLYESVYFMAFIHINRGKNTNMNILCKYESFMGMVLCFYCIYLIKYHITFILFLWNIGK